MKIAIIDDGIDQTHPFFAPAGYAYPPGFPKGQTAYTTPKVIVARAFAPATPVYANAKLPFDPDLSDHGIHVAGIAAGNNNTPTRTGGFRLSGIAPRAYLGNYKALGIPQSSSVPNGNSPELAAAIEAAVRDGMDVINLSLGETEIDPSRDLVGKGAERGRGCRRRLDCLGRQRLRRASASGRSRHPQTPQRRFPSRPRAAATAALTSTTSRISPRPGRRRIPSPSSRTSQRQAKAWRLQHPAVGSSRAAGRACPRRTSPVGRRCSASVTRRGRRRRSSPRSCSPALPFTTAAPPRSTHCARAAAESTSSGPISRSSSRARPTSPSDCSNRARLRNEL